MLKIVPLSCTALVASAIAVPLSAQDLAPHRAAYSVAMLDHGKPGGNAGTYAYELKVTCDGYVMNQRLRLEVEGGRSAVVTEQQSQMTESKDGRRLQFDHKSSANGKVTSQWKGEASLSDDGTGQARYSEPEGQTVALPAGTMFPAALTRATVKYAKAGDTSFDALFYYGEKVKPPQSVNVLIGKVPKRLVDLPIPEGAGALVANKMRVYYRGGFFEADAKAKGEQAAFEMSSLTLENGIELYGTHEQGEGGIEYRITRLEALPVPTCK
jgi:hypothetical protein